MSSEWVELTQSIYGTEGKKIDVRSSTIIAVLPSQHGGIYDRDVSSIVVLGDQSYGVRETRDEIRALLGIKHETDQDLILRVLRRHCGSAVNLTFGSLGPGVGFRFDEDGRLLGVEHAPR